MITAPVMVVFFIREENLRKQFETIRRAKPSKLLLVQDGARNKDDLERIKKCRNIVESVDWDCEVIKNYSDINLGAHKRIYTGLCWAFQQVDRLIYLEDDLVPTQSFYRFCTEMLEEYKDDNRIYGVCGAQKVGVYENYPYNVIFSGIAFTGFGWGTWRRVWNEIDGLYRSGWEKDRYFMEELSKNLVGDPGHGIKKEKIIPTALDLDIKNWNENGVMRSWHTCVYIGNCFGHRLSIFPAKNYVEYNGVDKDASYSGADVRILPKRVKKIFFQKAYDDLPEEIAIPPYMIRNYRFDAYYRKVTRGWQTGEIIERALLRLRYGDFKGLMNAFRNRVKMRK